MSKFRSKTPVSIKTIQPVIHQNIQPLITTEIQAVIHKEIQPVIHKEIQPVIHHNIQPIITKEIQSIIYRKIQPVIFNENQLDNIEQVIQQLNESHNDGIKEVYTTENIVQPQTRREEKHSRLVVVQPFLQKEEKHLIQTINDEKTEKITEKLEEIEFVPYIQKRNGEIIPYDVPYKSIIKNSTQSNETQMAVNFFSLSDNVNFPMSFKKTDIFSDVEKKLYKKVPKLKMKKIYFMASGRVVNRNWTFEQNKIEDGTTILINEFI